MTEIYDSIAYIAYFSCAFQHAVLIMIQHGNCGIKHIHQCIAGYKMFTVHIPVKKECGHLFRNRPDGHHYEAIRQV